MIIGGVAYEVAVPQNLPNEFFSKFRFDEESALDIEATAKKVLAALALTAETSIDIVTNKLLPKIPYHSFSYEDNLLREPGEIIAGNGSKVELDECANKQRCVSQYIRGFEGPVVMGWMTHQEWLLATTYGINSCPDARPCILCVRNQYTQRKLEHYLHQKSKVERRTGTADEREILPEVVQPFYNACSPDDGETYLIDRLMKVGDFPLSQRTGYADLDMPMVSFNKDDYAWYKKDGVLRVDQSKLRNPLSSPAANVYDEGLFSPEPGQRSGRQHKTVAGPFTLGSPFFEGRRDSVSAAQQPSMQLSRLCSPLYGPEILNLCFSANFVACAETAADLHIINPGEAFGYTSWFTRGGRLEVMAKENLYVKLLLVRLLIFNLLRKVQDTDLGYWLHIYIDQHIPFLVVVLHKDEITAEDVIEPCSLDPVCDSTIPMDEFLSHNAILSYKPWGTTLKPLEKLAAKFMPNTTTSHDKGLSWESLPADARSVLTPVLQCVFLGNFRHARFRPGIMERVRILSSPITHLLALANNDPLVLSAATKECITYLLERQGFADTEDVACQRYMHQTISDCDWLLRLAIAQQRPVTKSDIRFASKSHKPVFAREHRNMISPESLENKIFESAARAISFKLFTKSVKLSVRYCIYARTEGKTFAQKLRMCGFSSEAYRHCRAIIRFEMNQKKAYKRIAQDLKSKFPSDALIMCKLFACLPSSQRAELIPVDIDTYNRQLAVAQESPAHRTNYSVCPLCFTTDIPSVAGWRKEKRFNSDLKDGRVFCPHCEGKPSVMKISLMGVKLRLMDNTYMLCTKCIEPDVFTTSRINLQGAFCCKRCIFRKKATPIWPRIDKRRQRGRKDMGKKARSGKKPNVKTAREEA